MNTRSSSRSDVFAPRFGGWRCRAAIALGLLLALAASAPGAFAAPLSKIYLASFGSDANDGGRGTPKRNFQNAHDAIPAGGEIVVLDTAGYGTLAITKDLTVTCPPGVNGFITASNGVAAISIDAPGAVVAMRGLIIENGGNVSRGISVINVGTLSVSDCAISGFTFFGLDFSPGSNARLLVTRCTIRNTMNTAALAIQPTGGTASRALVNACHLETSFNGLLVKGAVRCTARDTVASNNSTGYEVEGGALLTLQRCTASRNTNGVVTTGANTLARVDACLIAGNGFFLLRQLDSSSIQSRVNNTLSDGANSAFGTYNAQ